MKKYILSSVTLALLLLLSSCDKRGRFDNDPPGITDNIVKVAEKQDDLSVFVAALKATGMDSTFDYLGFKTIFAPTNAAFAAIGINAGNVGTALPLPTLRAVLRYHMLNGSLPASNLAPGPNAGYSTLQQGEVIYTTTYASVNPGTWFNGRARVVATDLRANNGLLHKINAVLLPPPGNLWETINANSNLTYLAAAITRANLVSSFNSTTVLNLFAPTNAAFQAAGFATINDINNADPAVLADILRYHVITGTFLNAPVGTTFGLRGRLFSVDLRNGMVMTTLQGGTITVSTTGGASVRGNGNPANSNITSADLIARNGVIHVIDRVLLP
ncbi:MAG: fasciclin domain-containing protein [Lacibacter sp.]